MRRVTARGRRRVESRVAQYGVTREKLADLAESGGGWDVLHLSGHGKAGQILLERADGSPDPVSTAELIGLLRPMRARVTLAMVSACESAAATTAETLRWLGLDDPAAELETPAAQEAPVPPEGVVRALVAELRCTVVGSIVVSHHNLASCLFRATGTSPEQRAHRLAAALLNHPTGDTRSRAARARRRNPGRYRHTRFTGAAYDPARRSSAWSTRATVSTSVAWSPLGAPTPTLPTRPWPTCWPPPQAFPRNHDTHRGTSLRRMGADHQGRRYRSRRRSHSG
ncbi:MAG: hypothetical protein ACRDQX_03860 [Pseudonocardiaceae bacterium]